MTDTQAKQIRELRMRGVGYRAIASVAGLSRDAVRNYCRSHGLDGFAAAVLLNKKEQIQQGKACLNCSRPIEQPVTGRRRKFCKDACRQLCMGAFVPIAATLSLFMETKPENIAATTVMCMTGSGVRKKTESHI